MRSSKSRSRNKSNRQRSTLGNVVNRVFDSSGPEGKVRGTPQQIIEKYLTLARDAQLSGDRVAEQSFFQHAEHYTRMLGEAQREMAERQGQNQPRQDGEDQPRDHNGNGQHSGQQSHNGGRDHGNRDDRQPRDQQPRNHQPRDQQPGDHGGNRDRGPRDGGARDGGGDAPATPQPEDAVQPVTQDAAPATHQSPAQDDLAEGLPAAMSSADEDASEAGPVETPEAGAKPARSRAPRARTPRQPREGGSPAGGGRSRRKPAEDGETAPAPSDDSAA